MKLVSYLDNSDGAGLPGLPSLPSIPNHTNDSDFCVPCPAEPTKNLQQFYQVQERLQSDLLACDVRFSLFVAAATSYMYESLLRPFPKEFLDSNQRPDINAIFDTIADVDRLETILAQLINGNYRRYHVKVMNLLHAVLVRHGERVALSTLRPCEFEDLYTHLQIGTPRMAPTQIFEVTPSLKCAHTKEYTSLREQCPVRIGFYGAKLEKLYAMLTVGCLPMDKPLVLARNVDEALQLSPQSPGWGGSRCGALLRCVAVVEYVVVPAHVSVDDDNGLVTIREASCMQISYLMFFGQNFAKVESPLMRQPKLVVNWNDTVKWMEDNKYALSLGVYLMVLSLTSSSGRGILHRFACTGLHVLRKGFLKI